MVSGLPAKADDTVASATPASRASSRCVTFYNARRPHTGLQGKSPLDVVVNNVRGNFS